MNTKELSNLCQEVMAGKYRFVQNIDSLYAGKVMNCGDSGLTVEVFGRRFDWDAEHCRSVESTINPLGPPTNS